MNLPLNHNQATTLNLIFKKLFILVEHFVSEIYFPFKRFIRKTQTIKVIIKHTQFIEICKKEPIIKPLQKVLLHLIVQD